MPALRARIDDMYNPLDIAERVIMDRDWAFDRTDEAELLAEVNGTWCNYRVWMAWQEDSGGLTLSCSLDSKLPKRAHTRVHSLLALVNEKLWLGHFDISSEDGAVTFRHSMLIRKGARTSTEQLKELLDIAVEECERFYPAFQSVIWGGKPAAEAMQIALFDTVGEA